MRTVLDSPDMDEAESPKSPGATEPASQRKSSLLDEVSHLNLQRPKHVTFRPETSSLPRASQSVAFDSTMAGAAEKLLSQYNMPSPYSRIGCPVRLRHRGLGQWDELQYPIGEWLDDTSSMESEAEETDIEYDSDTSSSLSYKENELLQQDKYSSPPVLGVKDGPTGAIHSILKSRFTSYGGEGEDTAIELTLGQTDGTDGVPGVFRWVHLHDEVMDFDRFMEVSLQTLQLSVQEKRMVNRNSEASGSTMRDQSSPNTLHVADSWTLSSFKSCGCNSRYPNHTWIGRSS